MDSSVGEIDCPVGKIKYLVGEINYPVGEDSPGSRWHRPSARLGGQRTLSQPTSRAAEIALHAAPLLFAETPVGKGQRHVSRSGTATGLAAVAYIESQQAR